jgi:hypothetical protein
MSTIRHPVQTHLWWYAAAAVLTGAVLALMILTLWPSGSDPVPTQLTGTSTTTYHHFHMAACLAGHPVTNIELSSCASPVR